MIRGIVLASALLAGLITVSAQAETFNKTMLFAAHAPWNPLLGNGWSISADGVIDDGASQRLQNLIEQRNIPAGSSVRLNSPGGNLEEGMKLGKVIRKAGLYTALYDNYGKSRTHSVCYSACTLAFLGGVMRFMDDGAVYGVHRFYWLKSPRDGSDIAQIMSAVIVQYMRDMGVDPQLFTEMTQAGRDSIVVIPKPELERLNVLHDATQASWTIESQPQIGLYLSGRNDEGDQIIIECSRPILFVAINAKGQEQEILRSPFWDALLTANGIGIAIQQQRAAETHVDSSGRIIVGFHFNASLIAQMLQAKIVGMDIVGPKGEGQFAWFGMDFSEGAQKLQSMATTCPALSGS